jgi:transglutaminase-like putative cysteine protease
MRLSVVHETRYRYERPVRSLIQAMRLTPRPHHGQHILRWRIEPGVDGRLRPREDALGNVVHLFSSDGTVEEMTDPRRRRGRNQRHGRRRARRRRARAGAGLSARERTHPRRPGIQSFAQDAAAGTNDTLETLHRLLAAVHREMTFDVAPTEVGTTAREAFALRRASVRT